MKKIIFISLITLFLLTPISLVVSNNLLLFTLLTTYAEEGTVMVMGTDGVLREVLVGGGSGGLLDASTGVGDEG